MTIPTPLRSRWVIVVLLLTALVQKAQAEPTAGWDQMQRMRYRQAIDIFENRLDSDGGDRSAVLGKALALVNRQPYSESRIQQAVDILKKLQQEAPDDYWGLAGGHDGADSASAKALRKSLVHRWFDYWLKGEDTNIMDEPPVIYARRPGWDHADLPAFPPDTVENMTLYLCAQSREQNLPADPNATFDVRRPQPVCFLATRAPDGPGVHSNIANRPMNPAYGLEDALNDDLAGVPEALEREEIIFDATPLRTPVEILGSPAAILHVMPSCPRFQITVNLFDLAPNGTQTLISRGQFGSRSAEPGRHLKIEVQMRTIAYRVEKGHRLRLTLGNYDTKFAFPYFEPYVVRLFHDHEHPSAVEIPVESEDPPG